MTRQWVRNADRIPDVIAALKGKPYLSGDEIAEALGIERRAAKRAIYDAVDTGRVYQVRARKGPRPALFSLNPDATVPAVGARYVKQEFQSNKY